jgi:hypothetical protein
MVGKLERIGDVPAHGKPSQARNGKGFREQVAEKQALARLLDRSVLLPYWVSYFPLIFLKGTNRRMCASYDGG